MHHTYYYYNKLKLAPSHLHAISFFIQILGVSVFIYMPLCFKTTNCVISTIYFIIYLLLLFIIIFQQVYLIVMYEAITNWYNE